MKRRTLALLPALLLLLSLAACGAKDGMVSSDSAPRAPQEESANGMLYEVGWDGGDYAPQPDAPMEGRPQGGALPENAKMIYTATLELESKEFDGAVRALDQLVEEMGGWFEVRRVNQGGSSRSLTGTIRVPAERFAAFLDRAGESAHLVSREDARDDVSEAYYDSEARLATARTKLERLQALLAQAAAMEDIIALESALSDTELEIEYLTGSLRRYDSLIGYSTVTVSLWEVYRLSGDEEVPATFGQRLAAALGTGLQRGVEGLEDFLIAVARNWVALAFWAAVLLSAALLLRRRRKRRKAAAGRKDQDQDQTDQTKP